MTAPRTGWDTIADLRDAPEKLRDMALYVEGDEYDPVHRAVNPEEVRRWADAIQEFLDGTSDAARWKAYAMLGACTAVGALAGAVAVMVALR